MADGAVDNDFDEAARETRAMLQDTYDQSDVPTHQDLSAGDVAIDLITRQALFIIAESAPSVAQYYDDEDFDLANYKQHAWLPVTVDDPVFECVFIGGVDDLHSFSNTYDFPSGRLARVPIELAGDCE